MINVSKEYKEIMGRPIRNRAYISVGIGIIDQEAQATATADGTFAYWSHGNVFSTNQSWIEYATLEENYFKADGSMLFMPENDELMQLKNNGITTEEIRGIVRIDFPQKFAIKGLTLEFGSAYPTEFTVRTEEKLLTYTNNLEKFETMDVLGDTSYIIITPIAMVGGEQRFRIKSALMGVGLSYTNEQTKSFKLTEFASPISAELPKESISYSFYDEENRFDVDDDNSFIDYLETMQKIAVSFGLELDDGSVEWHKVATTYLKNWSSKKGQVSLTATDRLTQMSGKYTAGNKIYERTAYQEAQYIFADAGVPQDEYQIDEYLKDIVLTNPMPEKPHKQCLQLLANACRCILKQDVEGKILIRANFAVVLDPEDYELEVNGVTAWGKPGNIFIGENAVYAELMQDFFRADGSMYFLPEDGTYLQTGYVSEQISDDNGLFEVNPYIAITLPAAYSYYGVYINFNGNPPEEMIIHTYHDDELLESVLFTQLLQENYLVHDFLNFDKMVFEFAKGYPNNRVLVDKISFGNLTDYVLKRQDMMTNPVGYKEERVKYVRTKIYSFKTDSNGKAKEVEDDIYEQVTVGDVGVTKTIANPLISTQEQALLVAEWIGNYYSNNISYDINYRGEPRLSASDIIKIESDKKANLQVEIENLTLDFDKSFSGTLEVRRATANATGG